MHINFYCHLAMKRIFYFFVVLCLFACIVEARKKDGVKEDLPPNSRLRVGVKVCPHLVAPPAVCPASIAS